MRRLGNVDVLHEAMYERETEVKVAKQKLEWQVEDIYDLLIKTMNEWSGAKKMYAKKIGKASSRILCRKGKKTEIGPGSFCTISKMLLKCFEALLNNSEL